MQTPTINSPIRSLAACAVLVLLVSGCDSQRPDAAQVAAPGSADIASAPATDAWLGKWNGPEGTYLQLDGGEGQYEVTIQNLDGPATFQGTALGDQVTFERNGVKETISASDGAETGMKWLSEKSDCLTVRPGEGYCRD